MFDDVYFTYSGKEYRQSMDLITNVKWIFKLSGILRREQIKIVLQSFFHPILLIKDTFAKNPK